LFGVDRSSEAFRATLQSRTPHLASAWLADRGCRFDHGHEKRGERPSHGGSPREGRKAKVPLGGTRQILDPGVVKRGCEELGLDGFSSKPWMGRAWELGACPRTSQLLQK
jgi:hypothetical protein